MKGLYKFLSNYNNKCLLIEHLKQSFSKIGIKIETIFTYGDFRKVIKIYKDGKRYDYITIMPNEELIFCNVPSDFPNIFHEIKSFVRKYKIENYD